MWLDPSSGNMFGDPREWTENLSKLDPLLRKAFLHPEQLTAQERGDLETKLVSILADYLPDKEIRDLIHDAEKSDAHGIDPVRDAATKQTLEGKLALREIGVMRQRSFEYALLNPETGKMVTEADVAAYRKKRKAKRRNPGKNKRKPKG